MREGNKKKRVKNILNLKEDYTKAMTTDIEKSKKISSKNKFVKEAAKKAAGRIATRVFAPAGAFQAGYDIGTALDKKYRLSNKLADTAGNITKEYKTRSANLRKGKRK